MIREKVWSGKIAIRVVISAPETIGEHQYLLVARRGAYLIQYTPQIVSYFRRYLAEPADTDEPEESAGSVSSRRVTPSTEASIDCSDSISKDSSAQWHYECDGEALAWNRPVGLLHDISKGAPEKLWTVRLRKGSHPSLLALGSPALEVLRDYWTNQFKEACHIRDGSANAVMSLSREASMTLWNSIAVGKVEEFWKYAGPLIRPSLLRHVPLKVYSDGRSIQRLVSPSSNLSTELISLGVKPVQSEATDENVRRGESSLSNYHLRDLLVLLHGVAAPLDVPLAELYENAAYPDGFLHVVIHTS